MYTPGELEDLAELEDLDVGALLADLDRAPAELLEELSKPLDLAELLDRDPLEGLDLTPPDLAAIMAASELKPGELEEMERQAAATLAELHQPLDLDELLQLPDLADTLKP